MTTLSEGILSVKDFSISVFLPAVLVFALVFALLKKLDILGDKEWLAMIVSAATAMLFVTVIKATKFTHEFVSLAAMAIIVIVFLMLIIYFVSGPKVLEGGQIGLAVGAGAVVLLLVIIAFKRVFTGTYNNIVSAMSSSWEAIKNVLTEPDVMGMILLFATMIIVIILVTREAKGK